MSKILVACFSATGTTMAVAKRIAAACGADLREIRPAVPYSAADLDWTDKGSRSCRENADDACRPPMAEKIDVTPYDTVIIGFPLWWYKAPHIIETFLESGDFAGRKVAVFCTSGSSPLGRTVDILKPLAPKAEWKGGNIYELEIPSGSSEVKVQPAASSIFGHSAAQMPDAQSRICVSLSLML